MLVVLLSGAGDSFAKTEGPTEADVKAAAIYNLPLFVQWPEEKLLIEAPVFNICVFGKVSYRRELRVLETLEILKRPIRIYPIRPGDDYINCVLIVVGNITDSELRTALPRFDKVNVLTVGDRVKGAENGLIINLRIHEGLLKIDVNLTAAQRAQLIIGSQLLGIANIVEDQKKMN